MTTSNRVTEAGQVRLLLGSVFLAYLAQTTLGPVIAPLSREVGLAEWQVGVTISMAALMVVLSSQFWGRSSQSRGRKPVLVLALTMATAAMVGFAVITALGMAGIITGAVLFVLFVLFRGLLFGTAIAAVPPTAQAYIADVTHDEPSRVRGMASLGAVQGVAMIGGAVVGGALSAFGLWVPLVAVPVLLAASVVAVAARLKRQDATALVESPARVRPRDPRVWPFLVAGFGMFTALGLIQIIAGFIVQDRLDLTAAAAGTVTGIVLLAAGVGMVIAQAVVVPRSGWSPGTLLRVGTVVALAGLVGMIIDGSAIVLSLAVGTVGLGLGIAIPGYTAGPSLLMAREEHGGLAGLIGATNGLTYVMAPTLGTALYGVAPLAPILVSCALMAMVAVFVWTHPRLKNFTSVVAVDHGSGPTTDTTPVV